MTKNVIVTGAASGIGRGIATAAVERGDRVFLLDIDGDGVSTVAAGIGAAGSAGCDVSDPELVESTIASAFDALGEVDLVVHAAGVSVGGPVLAATPADLRFVTDVNVLGTMYVAGSAGRRLVRQDHPSRMVFVGSEHSLGVPHVLSAAYTASKHAVLGYADVLRRELPDHVGVSVLCPGLVDTDLWRSDERRGSTYGGPREVRPAMASVMKAGMSTTEIAERLFVGVDAGEFLIPTHGFSRNYAAERAREVDEAFDRLAPDATDDQYDLGRIVPQMAAGPRP